MNRAVPPEGKGAQRADAGILGIWQSMRDERQVFGGIWIEWTDKTWREQMREKTIESISLKPFAWGGRRGRQSAFVIIGPFFNGENR